MPTRGSLPVIFKGAPKALALKMLLARTQTADTASQRLGKYPQAHVWVVSYLVAF
jgi:hypothetical protein